MNNDLIELLIEYFMYNEKRLHYERHRHNNFSNFNRNNQSKAAIDIMEILNISMDLEEFDDFIFSYTKDKFLTTNYKDLKIILERDKKLKDLGI
jgi:hypothetical protein